MFSNKVTLRFELFSREVLWGACFLIKEQSSQLNNFSSLHVFLGEIQVSHLLQTMHLPTHTPALHSQLKTEPSSISMSFWLG